MSELELERVSEWELAGVGVGVGWSWRGLGEGAGGLVSTVKETALLASDPSVLALLAASVKVPLATEITPLAVLLLLGVGGE